MDLPGAGSGGEGTQEFQPGGLLRCMLRGLGLGSPLILWLHLGQEERKLRTRVWGEEHVEGQKPVHPGGTVVLKDTHVSPGPSWVRIYRDGSPVS